MSAHPWPAPASRLQTLRPGARRVPALVALLLLLVLGPLGAGALLHSRAQMARLNPHPTSDAAPDTLSARALLAARAGLSWGLYRALQDQQCVDHAALPDAVGNTGFAVQVRCRAHGPYAEGGYAVTVYEVWSTATAGAPGHPSRRERTLHAVVSSR